MLGTDQAAPWPAALRRPCMLITQGYALRSTSATLLRLFSVTVSEDDRPPTVHDHPIVEVQRHRSREHEALDVAPDVLEVVGALAVVDADDVLVDDRPVVELLCDVVRGRADQLDAPLARLVIRVGARKRWQERVVDVDRRHTHARQEVSAEDLHVARQHEQLGIALQKCDHRRLSWKSSRSKGSSRKSSVRKKKRPPVG